MSTATVTKSVKALIIQPSNTFQVARIATTLGAMQNVVGGYIECVKSPYAHLWCNEDGKVLGLPINMMATYLWWKLVPDMEGLDHIVGPCFVTGPPEAENTTDIPDDIIDLYLRMEAIREDEGDAGPNADPCFAERPLP